MDSESCYNYIQRLDALLRQVEQKGLKLLRSENIKVMTIDHIAYASPKISVAAFINPDRLKRCIS